MKERPILFNAEMVRAILDGRKTQTRRICKEQPIDEPIQHHLQGADWSLWRFDFRNEVGDVYYKTIRCPYGKVGDRLWVKEKHSLGGNGVFFPDNCDGTVHIAWTSARFMKKIYARIWLEITNIRVEKVQEISEIDIKAEGIDIRTDKSYTLFPALWDSINAKCGFGWDKNCWVWVIEFKKVGER